MNTTWVAVSSGDSGIAVLVASPDRQTAVAAAVVEAIHLSHSPTEVRDALGTEGNAEWNSDELDTTLAVQQTEIRRA